MNNNSFHTTLIVGLCFLFTFVPAMAQPELSTVAVDSTKSQRATKAAMVFEGDTLLYIGAPTGAFTAQDRAEAIVARMERLAKRKDTRIDSLTYISSESSTDILAGDTILMTITEQDAAISGLPRAVLADQFRDKLFKALSKEMSHFSILTILLGVFLTLLITAFLILVLRLLNRLFPKIYSVVKSWKGTKIRSLKIQNLEVLSSDRIIEMIGFAVKIVRISLVCILFYIYLPLVFSFFPWTRGLAAILFGYVFAPLKVAWRGLIGYLPNVFFISIITIITHYFLKLIKWIFTEIDKETIMVSGFYKDWALPTFKIVRFLVIAFAAVVIFPYLPGSGSPAFQGVGVFLGLLFSLGSASSISNVVAGIVLTYMRAFSIGDRVKIADTVGDVMSKTLLITRIRTVKNVEITIANSMVLNSHIINFSSLAKQQGLILHTTVTIGYDVPWKKVHELLIKAAEATEHIKSSPAPFVLQTSLDDFYVSYELNAYTNAPDKMALIYSELHQKIQDFFNEGGVEILSPHYSALRDGNQVTIPENYLPKSYRAPSFRILPTAPLPKTKQPSASSQKGG